MPFPNVFRRNKGTSSRFGPPAERNLLPAAPAEVRPAEVVAAPAAEEAAEQQAETTDRQVQRNNNRSEIADNTETRRGTRPANIVQNNESRTDEHTTSTAAPLGVYSAFWSDQLNYTFTKITTTRAANFIPNGIPLQEIMMQAGPLVWRSNHLLKYEATYNEYACFTGLCILYYIQILRAKRAASDLDGVESSLLTRLFKAYPEEMIPIPEPFFPYFNTLVATELEDDRYDWIIPQYQNEAAGHGIGEADHTKITKLSNCLDFLRPNVPYMLMNLASFGAMSETDMQAHINTSGVFTPIALSRTGTTHVFGADRDFHSATTITQDASFLSTLGLSFPFRFLNDNRNDARLHMRETDFYGAKGVINSALTGQSVVTEDGFTVTLVDTARDTSKIDAFLNMEKAKSMKWFGYCLEQIRIFSQYWNTEYNLSQVSTTGGLESTMIANLRKSDITGGVRYADHHLGLTHSRDIVWYNQRLRGLSANFKTTRAGTARNEELQAITFAPNAILPITYANGQRSLYAWGAFFIHTDESGGPKKHIGTGDNTEGAVQLYQGWGRNIFRTMFKAKA